MFCLQCGKSLDHDAAYCPECGTHVTAQEPIVPPQQPTLRTPPGDLTRPLVILRPTYIFLISLLSQGAIALVGAIIVAFYLPCLGWLLALPIFLIAWPVLMYFYRSNIEQTEYIFYPDRVEYTDGFFNRREQVVSYRNVVEVTLSSGVIEQRYGLGSITLATSGGKIRISAIERTQAMYTKVKELIDAAQVRK